MTKKAFGRYTFLNCLFCTRKYDFSFSKQNPGVFVNGLYMEGARWSKSANSVAESKKKVLYDLLPIVSF